LLPHILEGAKYIATLDLEVMRAPLRVDRVYKMRYRRRIHLLHIEFETGPDGEMAYRLLEYHSYLLRKYKYPVISIIVYPFEASVAVVEGRFPPLKPLAQEQVKKVTEPVILNLLIRQISVAPDENTARLALNLIAA